MTIHRTRLAIRDPNHALGQDTHVERHSVRQALAWSIAAELVRRHPSDLRVVERHPYREYDCVAVYARASADDVQWPGGWRTVMYANKAPTGVLTHEGWFSDEADPDRFNWLEVLLCKDLRTDVIEPLEVAEALSSPSETPPTTAASIGVRLLATFAQRTALSRKPWTLLNGYVDSRSHDGYDYDSDGQGVREELFGQLPEVDVHRRQRQADDLFEIPEYRYWFVTENHIDGQPGPARLAVDTMAGVAFTTVGSVDLMTDYDKCGRMIDAVASRICPPAF